jgi:hypothetical protein
MRLHDSQNSRTELRPTSQNFVGAEDGPNKRPRRGVRFISECIHAWKEVNAIHRCRPSRDSATDSTSMLCGLSVLSRDRPTQLGLGHDGHRNEAGVQR